MKRILLLAALLAAAFTGQAKNDPVAPAEAQVVVGNARFTVLTDRLIRMEWSENGRFEDHATLAIVNRNLPVPKFTATRSGDGATIRTSAVTLTYKGGKFAEDRTSSPRYLRLRS